MIVRVSGRPDPVRISKGEIIFHPLLILPSKILNYSSRGFSVKISFRAEGILFNNTGEVIPHTDQISRNIFQAHSISSITFKPKLKASDKTEAKLREFFRTGNINHIRDFIADIAIIPPIDQLIKEGRPIIDLPVTLGTIPGQYKHYTNYENYERIMRGQMLMTTSYEGRVARICMTTSSLNENKVWRTIFLGDSQYIGKGGYVVGFDFRRRVSLEKPNPHFDGYWYRGNIKFGEDADLRFAGLNPVR